jgi:hypothetical protein
MKHINPNLKVPTGNALAGSGGAEPFDAPILLDQSDRQDAIEELAALDDLDDVPGSEDVYTPLSALELQDVELAGAEFREGLALLRGTVGVDELTAIKATSAQAQRATVGLAIVDGQHRTGVLGNLLGLPLTFGSKIHGRIRELVAAAAAGLPTTLSYSGHGTTGKGIAQFAGAAALVIAVPLVLHHGRTPESPTVVATASTASPTQAIAQRAPPSAALGGVYAASAPKGAPPVSPEEVATICARIADSGVMSMLMPSPACATMPTVVAASGKRLSIEPNTMKPRTLQAAPTPSTAPPTQAIAQRAPASAALGGVYAASAPKAAPPVSPTQDLPEPHRMAHVQEEAAHGPGLKLDTKSVTVTLAIDYACSDASLAGRAACTIRPRWVTQQPVGLAPVQVSAAHPTTPLAYTKFGPFGDRNENTSAVFAGSDAWHSLPIKVNGWGLDHASGTGEHDDARFGKSMGATMFAQRSLFPTQVAAADHTTLLEGMKVAQYRSRVEIVNFASMASNAQLDVGYRYKVTGFAPLTGEHGDFTWVDTGRVASAFGRPKSVDILLNSSPAWIDVTVSWVDDFGAAGFDGLVASKDRPGKRPIDAHMSMRRTSKEDFARESAMGGCSELAASASVDQAALQEEGRPARPESAGCSLGIKLKSLR